MTRRNRGIALGEDDFWLEQPGVALMPEEHRICLFCRYWHPELALSLSGGELKRMGHCGLWKTRRDFWDRFACSYDRDSRHIRAMTFSLDRCAGGSGEDTPFRVSRKYLEDNRHYARELADYAQYFGEAVAQRAAREKAEAEADKARAVIRAEIEAFHQRRKAALDWTRWILGKGIARWMSPALAVRQLEKTKALPCGA